MTAKALKAVIIFFFVLVTLQGALAVYEDEPPIALYRFTDGSLSDSYGIGDDFTNIGATNTTTNCNAGNCYSFDGTNDYLYINSSDSNPLTRVGLSSADYTICVWNDKVGTGQKGMFEIGVRSISPYTVIQFSSNRFYAASGSGWSDAGASDRSLAFVCVRSVDGVGITTSQNGTAFGSLQASTSTPPATDWSRYMELGTFRVNNAAGDFWDGTLDDFMLFNYSLSDAQVAAVYANTSGNTDCPFTTCEGTASEVPFFPTLLSPSDALHTSNATVVFGYNVSLGTSTSVNCSLMLDGGVSQSTTGITTNATLNFNHSNLNETSYNWAVRCYNGSSYNTTTNRTLVVDRTNPIIDTQYNFFGFANQTSINTLVLGYTHTLNLTFTDTYLWAYNVTIWNESGTVVYSNQTINLTSTSETLASSIDFTSYGLGTYTVNVTVEDDHTATTIPEYGTTITQQYIEYRPPSGNVIRIESVEGNIQGETVKLDDRYTFSFDWGSARNEHQVALHCDEQLYYRGDLYEWPTFVCGQHWIDFVPAGLTAADFEAVLVKRTSPTAYTINFKTVEKVAKLSWESLGGLNTVNNEVEFSLYAMPRQVQNLTASSVGIDWVFLEWDIYPEVDQVDIYKNGLYDGQYTNGSTSSNRTIGLVENTCYTYTLYAFNNSVQNTSITSENNISACTLSNASISIYIRDELSEALISNQTVYVSLISDSNNVSYNTSTGTVDISNISTENYTIRTSSNGYGTRDFYQAITANFTDTYTVYLISETDYLVLPLSVTDLQGSALNDIRVDWLRWLGSQNAYVTMEMVTTRENGQANLMFEPADGWYKAIIYNTDGTVVKTIEAKRYSTTDATNGIVWAIDEGTDIFESWIPAVGMISANDLTYNNATLQFSFTYADTDNILTQICLKVYEIDRRTTTLLNSTCSNSSSGTLVTGHATSTATILATVELETNTAHSDYTLTSKTVEYITNSLSTFGKYGPFLATILISSVALVAANPAVAIVFGVAGLLISVLGIGLAITKTWVLTIAIVGAGLLGLFAWRDGK